MDIITSLSDQLQPYKDHVASIASTVTFLQLLTPILLINDIRKAKTTGEFSIAPFLGGGVLSVLFVQFGQMIGDDTTVKINIIGFLLSALYICAFYYYTPINQKLSVWAKIGAAGAFSCAIIVYSMYEDPEVVEMRFGLILTGLLYMLIAFPMLGLKDVIRTKSTESLPFPLIFMGFVVSFAWLVYGVILNSMFMIIQNLFAVLLSGFQLSFFAIYPSKSADAKKKKN